MAASTISGQVDHPQFPTHETYVEPFGGGASILLNKPPAPVEVYNDKNPRITRLFRVIRNQGEASSGS